MNLFKRFVKHKSCFTVSALILLLGAMFISCTEPEGIIFNNNNAQQPSISAQPAGGFWNVYPEDNDTFDLTVTADVSDGGDLKYQWYSNTSNSANGSVAITSGGTNKTLSLSKDEFKENGPRYFYVIVTNTNNDVSGIKTASVTSDVAEVTVVGNPDDDYTTSVMPEELKGTWTYDWGGGYIEKYIVDEITFTSEYTYAGTIAGHRSNSSGEGYITIKFTENFGYIDSENKFYVIHYKDLSISEVTLAGAWLGADPDFEYGVGPGGKATQAEAEATMTVSSGYFGMYSILNKEGYTNAAHPHISAQPSSGSWNANSANTFNLTVSANISDEGTLSYQWYSNTSASNSGGKVIAAGGTGASLTLNKVNYSENGTYYFYVVVTNTNDEVNGNKTASVTSNVATVTVSGNSAVAQDFKFPAEWIGEWFPDNYMDLFLFTAPNILANYFLDWGMGNNPDYVDTLIESDWVYFYEIEVLDMAQDGDEIVLCGKFSKLGEYFTASGSGEYSAIYINKMKENEMEILLISKDDWSTPMYETLEAAKAALPLDASFRNKYINESVVLSYTKN